MLGARSMAWVDSEYGYMLGLRLALALGLALGLGRVWASAGLGLGFKDRVIRLGQGWGGWVAPLVVVWLVLCWWWGG